MFVQRLRFVFNKFGGRRGKKRGYFVWERLAPLVLLGGVCFLMSYTFLAMLMANGDVTIGARNAQVGLLKGFEGLVDYVDNGFRIFALAVKYAERLRALVLEVLETSDDVFTAFLPAFQPVFDLLPGLYTLGQEADTTLQDAKEGLASLELSYNRLLDSVDALNSAVYNVLGLPLLFYAALGRGCAVTYYERVHCTARAGGLLPTTLAILVVLVSAIRRVTYTPGIAT